VLFYIYASPVKKKEREEEEEKEVQMPFSISNWLEQYKKNTLLLDKMEGGSSLLIIHDSLLLFCIVVETTKCCKHADQFKTLLGYDAMFLNYLILI